MEQEKRNVDLVKLHIKGMSCLGCEERIYKALNSMAGIINVKVSYAAGRADITFDRSVVSLTDIEKKINALGYSISLHAEDSKISIFIALVKTCVILILFGVLQYFGLLNFLVPSRLADRGMGYGTLFVTGILTSVHCIAMCGGINLSQSLPSERIVKGCRDTLLPSLMYNLGRVISYTVIGFLLGLVGMVIGGGSGTGISYLLQGVLKIVAGVFMIIMGINMLGIFPGLRNVGIKMPAVLSRKISRIKGRSKTPLLVGLMNGLMPCGPLQSMQIIALASANPITGAISMFAFSLGTVPLMLGMGSLVSMLGRKFAEKVLMVGSIFVVVLGLSMLSQGGSLSGLFSPKLLFLCIVLFATIGFIDRIPFQNASTKQTTFVTVTLCAALMIASWSIWSPAVLGKKAGEQDSARVMDGIQVVRSTLSPGRYPSIEIQKGMPVKWIIEASEEDINGCNYRILVDEFDMEYTFHVGENVIEFLPEESGSFTYSCWMGMIHGNINVTE